MAGTIMMNNQLAGGCGYHSDCCALSQPEYNALAIAGNACMAASPANATVAPRRTYSTRSCPRSSIKRRRNKDMCVVEVKVPMNG
jgi:hypothetical protein